MFASTPVSTPHIRAGKLRPLAVTSATRPDALPDVPTVGEFVPGYEASGWFGVGAPRNTPAEIIDKLNKEINAALADPNMKARLADLSFALMPIGMYAGTITPSELVRNWTWTLTGNLLGGIFFAWLLWFSWTYGGSVAPPVPGQRPLLIVIAQAAEHKIEYIKYGALGWCAAIGMGNWLVSLGSIMSKASRSTVGRAKHGVGAARERRPAGWLSFRLSNVASERDW
jgi:Tripartite tricarboxylate transporter family receptor/Formate/nitrite transporter